MTGAAVVRARRAGDLPACVAGLAEVHHRDRYPTPVGLAAAWVAVDDGVVQGHLALVRGVEDEQLVRAAGRPPAEIAAVSRLFVRPGARGRGLGERLLGTVAERAVRDRLALVLEVVEDDRSAAIRLYGRLGWQQVGRRTATWLAPDGSRPGLLQHRWVPAAAEG